MNELMKIIICVVTLYGGMFLTMSPLLIAYYFGITWVAPIFIIIFPIWILVLVWMANEW